MKKNVKWILGIVIVVCIAGYVFSASMKPLTAELIEIQPMTVAQEFEEEGIVEATDQRPIHSIVSGKIIEVGVKEGQTVKKGQMLVKLDTKDLEYQVNQLKAQQKSLEGQEKKTYQEMKQQLGQLRGQLESIKGQERQGNRSPYEAEIAQQQLGIEETKRQLKNSEEEYERMKLLFEGGAIAKKELDSAQNNIAQLKNSLSRQEQSLRLIMEQANPLPGTNQYFEGLKKAVQAQIDALEYEGQQGSAGNTGTKQYYQGLIEASDTQIKQLEQQIANNSILSPIDGRISALNAKVGAMAFPQTPLMMLLGAVSYEVNAYLLTEDVLGVKEGMKVKLIQERREGDYEFDGVVKSIAPSAEEKVSALGLIERRIKVTVLPEGKIPELKPGYALDVRFTILQQENKLAVAKTTLFPYEDGEAVWVVRDGKAVIQKVKKGLKTDNLVVIEEGLSPGDQVIKNPELEGLDEGKRITAQ